jgi:hypothetical protein
MSIPWLRLYTETLSDRKIKLISVELNLPKPLIIGVWVSLLMLAGESPDRGKLISSRGKPWPTDFLCDEIGIDNETFTQIINEFMAFEMIYVNDGNILAITNWDQRQFKSDNSYERVKKFRSKTGSPGGESFINSHNEYAKGNVSGNANETFQETPQIQIQNQIHIDDEEETKLAKIFRMFYDNVTLSVSPMTAQEMQSEEYFILPIGWWQEAFKIAGDNNKKTWAYVRGILDRSIKLNKSPLDAGPPKQKGHSNGQNKSNAGTGKAPPDRITKRVDIENKRTYYWDNEQRCEVPAPG